MNSLSGNGETNVRTIRVPDDLWQDFRRACSERGLSASQVLRLFMQQSIQGENASPGREESP